MTTSLGVPACEANCWALTSGHRQAYLISSIDCLKALDASSHFDGVTCVSGPMIVKKSNAFKIMCPDTQSACSGRFTIVVMACIPNDKPNVVFRGERHPFRDICGLSDIDCVFNIVSQRAEHRFWGERYTAVSGVERGHYR